MSNLDEIKNKIRAYKKKFYVRQLVIGLLSFFTIAISLFLIISYIEHELWMDSSSRAVLFFGFIAISITSLSLLVIQPTLKIINLNKGLPDEDAAAAIARFFPEIEDRLLNLLQLGRQETRENELIKAAIDKKALEFKSFSFVKAVDFSVARKYLSILGLVICCLLLVSFIKPDVVKDSPKRIANYNTAYERVSPFQFELINSTLNGFRGEDFTFSFKILSELIPEEVYLLIGDQLKIQLTAEDDAYSYSFKQIQSDKKLIIEAGGFQSKQYEINVLDRPELVSMNIFIDPPSYTGGSSQGINNTGELTIAEGSRIRWELETLATRRAELKLNEDTSEIKMVNEGRFIIEKRIFKSGTYEILLENDFSKNTSGLSYSINVIEDLFPKIQASFFPDSSSYQFVTLAGTISDDYGFSGLGLYYKKDEQNSFRRIPLEINNNLTAQSYFANWNLDSLGLEPGSSLELYVQVQDNDQINGPKSTKSNPFIFQIPTKKEIDDLITSKSKGVENQLDNAKDEAENISEKLLELSNRLKSEQKFDWQEKKLLEEVIRDREELSKQIEELQKQHEELQKANQQFKKQSSDLQDKNQKMQELLNELMDEETRKLYEKLKELMKENGNQDQISQELNELTKNEKNLERDLERALELFKRLKMESTLEQTLQALDTLSSQQESLSKEFSENQENDEIKKEQEEIQQEFEEFREKMDQVEQMNQELKRPEAMEDFEYEERQIANELKKIMEELESEEGEDQDQTDSSNSQNQESPDTSEERRKSIQEKQKNAAEKMKSLSQKMSKMQGGMQMEMMQANLDQLRDILDNLVKLSFNQEDIMMEMREVDQSDPRFLELSQNQLKLKDDAKVIQDSLLSLASKVVQISSFVTKEVGKINENIDETITQLKERNRNRALTGQQFAMTSINNLALLLDDTMQQMQMAMAEAMGNSSGEKKQSKGLPDMQELQNQLGEKINELKGSGKSGRELSEELARLAAEQEMIRRQMEILKEAEDGKPGGGLGSDDLQRAIELMEQNEVDLVNKRLTQQLINRQKQIQTRMLEAEKAQREQEMEEERESNSPGIITREIPPEFEEYLKLKKKEIELLKTIPIELNPFYKKEVNDYFRRISTDNKE